MYLKKYLVYDLLQLFSILSIFYYFPFKAQNCSRREETKPQEKENGGGTRI